MRRHKTWNPSARRRHQARRSPQGFSMVDNMMAMLIFAAGSSVLMVAVDHQIHYNTEAAELTAATTLARNIFEDLRRRDPEEYLTTGMPSGTIGPLDASGHPSPSGQFFVTWDYTDDVPSKNLKTVQIAVSWEGEDKSHAITFLSAVRAPRTKPSGFIMPWTGITPEMLSYGDCDGGATPNPTPTPTPPPAGEPTPTPPSNPGNGHGNGHGYGHH